MKDYDFILKFATSYEIENNRYSCLMIALQDARKISGRDINSGKMQNNILKNHQCIFNPFSFIGVINYLLILELIGGIFKKKSYSNNNNNIYNALCQFSSLSVIDIYTIIALRNSLAHNYGLINIPKAKKEYSTKLHKFILLNDISSNLIVYPKNKWNLDYSDKSDETATQISIVNLQDLIENVYQKVIEEINNNSVELTLKGEVEELKARFTIRN